MYPDSLNNLIESFKTLPGIGAKTAERLAFALLELDKEQIELFSTSMLEAKEKIHRCKRCNMMTDEDLCFICRDKDRESSKVLCVVENSKNVFLLKVLP